MSVEHMAVVLHHSRAKGTAKLVLLGIANHQGDGGSWPGVNRLATYANVHPRNVQKALAWLVSAGEVAVFLQDGGERHWEDRLRPNRYEVLVRCPGHCDHTPQHRDTRKLAGAQLTTTPMHRGGVFATPPPPTGGDSATPTPGASATLTTHLTPPTPVSTSTTDRARGPVCAECSQPRDICEARQRRLRPDDRHTHSPRPARASR